MKLTFNNFATIGYDKNFQPVLSYKIGQRKKAIQELTDYFNRFNDFYRTCIGMLTEGEYLDFSNRFHAEAESNALKFIQELENSDNICFFNNRFFAYLPKK